MATRHQSYQPIQPIRQRLDLLDWTGIERQMNENGYAQSDPILTPRECEDLASLYTQDSYFRSTIVMERHRFGQGEYRYFAYPLPDAVAELRKRIYPFLSSIANSWNDMLGVSARYPADHAHFLRNCNRLGQVRPTPLLLHYDTGGYNCLHQDLYGELAFPIQVLCLLDRPREDFDGGEFVLVEQRPRAQSIARVVSGKQGALIFFTTRSRPVRGSRGYYKVNVRHGVSPIRRGSRRTLGIIFHDAK